MMLGSSKLYVDGQLAGKQPWGVGGREGGAYAEFYVVVVVGLLAIAAL
jgi:hypothetical protein